jgi:hypothetical protein
VDVNAPNVRRTAVHRATHTRLNRVSHRVRASDPVHEEFELLAVQLLDERQAWRTDDRPKPVLAVEAQAHLALLPPILEPAEDPVQFHAAEHASWKPVAARGRAPPSSL